MIYLIATPGRTGSKMLMQLMGNIDAPGGICNALYQEDTTDYTQFLKLKDSFNLVLHTHQLDIIEKYNLDPREITLILSKREDVFSAIMSMCIGQKTQEWQHYSDKEMTPFKIEKDHFLILKKFYDTWDLTVDRTLSYNNIVTIYYEDLVKYGAFYIAHLLKIRLFQVDRKGLTPKSPYRYQDLILNWKELLDLYNTPLSFNG